MKSKLLQPWTPREEIIAVKKSLLFFKNAEVTGMYLLRPLNEFYGGQHR